MNKLPEYVRNANAELRSAMFLRDSIENCCSDEWREAHKVARAAAMNADNAFKIAYETGDLLKPYWA